MSKVITQADAQPLSNVEVPQTTAATTAPADHNRELPDALLDKIAGGSVCQDSLAVSSSGDTGNLK